MLSSVSAKGSNQVVFQFSKPSVPYFYYIADETPIVPEHIWSSIKDPVTYLDKNPIGTGPYTMSHCSGANIQYKKNPNYWQHGLPKIETVNFPSYLSNNAANADLASGVDQWGSQYMPNIKAYYLTKNPNYHFWFEPTYNVNIYINLKNPILSNLAVRQAMSYAINRSAVSQIGESGYEPASNQTSIVKPTFSSWYDSSQAASYGNAYSYDPAKAISILEAAGYTKGSDGIFEKDGKPLSFTIINNGGFSDWVAAVNVIQQDLKAVGISLTPDNLSNTTWLSDLDTGRYQLAYSWDSGGPTPYYELRALLYSANTAPIGKSASDDWERYINPSTDALFQTVRLDDQPRRPAPGRGQAGEGHARRRPGDPGHRGGRLVPVRHPEHRWLGDAERPVRPAQPVRLARLGGRAAAPVPEVTGRRRSERRASE